MAKNNPYPLDNIPIPKSEQVNNESHPSIIISHNIAEYDPLHAIDTLCDFGRFLREVTSRFEENERIRIESEKKSNDLLHYIELSDDMNASDGYKAYKKLAEVRRERRCCKNENELLTPVYTFIQQNPKVINELSSILGRCRGIKEVIDKRAYCPRTDIL